MTLCHANRIGRVNQISRIDTEFREQTKTQQPYHQCGLLGHTSDQCLVEMTKKNAPKENVHPSPLNLDNQHVTSASCRKVQKQILIMLKVHRQRCPYITSSRASSLSLDDSQMEKNRILQK